MDKIKLNQKAIRIREMIQYCQDKGEEPRSGHVEKLKRLLKQIEIDLKDEK